ncbi:MAG: four helix bundle protein [Bacteroidota bacterium]
MKKATQKKHVLKEKTLKFAIRIVNLNRHLVYEKREFVLSKQILKSGTNPGAMAREAANAESGKDFIHKLSIAQKENGETQYWLELLHATDFISKAEFDSLSSDCEEIGKIITSSIKTKKRNLGLKTFLFLIFATTYLTWLIL